MTLHEDVKKLSEKDIARVASWVFEDSNQDDTGTVLPLEQPPENYEYVPYEAVRRHPHMNNHKTHVGQMNN